MKVIIGCAFLLVASIPSVAHAQSCHDDVTTGFSIQAEVDAGQITLGANESSLKTCAWLTVRNAGIQAVLCSSTTFFDDRTISDICQNTCNTCSNPDTCRDLTGGDYPTPFKFPRPILPGTENSPKYPGLNSCHKLQNRRQRSRLSKHGDPCSDPEIWSICQASCGACTLAAKKPELKSIENAAVEFIAEADSLPLRTNTYQVPRKPSSVKGSSHGRVANTKRWYTDILEDSTDRRQLKMQMGIFEKGPVVMRMRMGEKAKMGKKAKKAKTMMMIMVQFPTPRPTPRRRPTPRPTPMPTAPQPTPSPTTSPPSLSPSLPPTGAPTDTARPSPSPSLIPSAAPTTPFPSASPSLSFLPTTSPPSMTPTTTPSEMPSPMPSSQPSVNPTSAPSSTPTAPTSAPSTVPSVSPSLSVVPSASPSESPTASTEPPTTSPAPTVCADPEPIFKLVPIRGTMMMGKSKGTKMMGKDKGTTMMGKKSKGTMRFRKVVVGFKCPPRMAFSRGSDFSERLGFPFESDRFFDTDGGFEISESD